MVLGDGEVQRIFQQGPGFVPAIELDQQFAEKYPGHHPIRFFRDTEAIVLDRFRAATFRDQGLREAETKHFVGRIARDEGAELLRSRGHVKASR